MAMSKRSNLFMSSQEFQKKINGSSHRAASAILQSKNSSTSIRNGSVGSIVLKDSSKSLFSSAQIETAWSKAI